MENSARVLFQTSKQYALSSTAGLSDLTDQEVMDLLLQTRQAVLSLEAEGDRRKLNINKKSGPVRECLDQLLNTVKRIRILERLEKQGIINLEIAVEMLKSPPTERKAIAYQEFIHDVLRRCGAGIAVLCAAGLGKHKIGNLNSADRVDLLAQVMENVNDLSSPILDMFAEKYHLHSLATQLNGNLRVEKSNGLSIESLLG